MICMGDYVIGGLIGVFIKKGGGVCSSSVGSKIVYEVVGWALCTWISGGVLVYWGRDNDIFAVSVISGSADFCLDFRVRTDECIPTGMQSSQFLELIPVLIREITRAMAIISDLVFTFANLFRYLQRDRTLAIGRCMFHLLHTYPFTFG